MRLVNARLRASQNPQYTAASEQEIASIVPLSWVKIASDGVRFWVQIQRKSGRSWSALTSDDQRVTVRPENVIAVAPAYASYTHQEEPDSLDQDGDGMQTLLIYGAVAVGLFLLTRRNA